MRTVVRLAAALALALGIVTPVLAKEGVEARLDQAIPLTGDPGTPIVVGFTLASMTGDDATGAPVYLRVHPVGGDPVEVPAMDDGTGHYTATFTMPEHGVAAVEIGMRGESCENGACTRSDFMFQVAGPDHGGVFVPVNVPPPANPGKVTPTHAPAPVPAEATTTTSTPPVLPLLALGLLIVAGGAALAFSSRRTTHAA